MTTLTIRNLPEEVHRALRARASLRGHSMSSEVREILGAATRPQERVKLGTLLVDVGRQARLSDDEFAVFERLRDTTPSATVSFK